ncbi:Fic family protein [Actinomyces faecalis]|uniref:Fic family protein n=1 Tax=Actinomyces faecalis TaxID=2722820 RepID=UPI001557DE65|nr:Fic family protein [Actinomyces faecalis]
MTASDIGADLHGFAIRYNRRACGADHAVLSPEKLAGACGRAFQTFDGAPLATRVTQRAAMILDAINQAHAFQDGNKRTAWMSMIYFLDRSGFTIEDVPESQGTRVAWRAWTTRMGTLTHSGAPSRSQIVDWEWS